jgi:tetratricopeptide (TPR) repeat protein
MVTKKLSHSRSLLAAFSISCFIAGCSPQPNTAKGISPEQLPQQATYVGGQQCSNCHQQEWGLWVNSHHDLSFQTASPDSVLGNFSNTTFSYNGIMTEFFMRNDVYWTKTDGPDGALTEYEITHAIGSEPLQQYVAKFPDGHYQVLGIAWDTRPTDEGGQRWFHLYPDGAIDNNDPLHWTGVYQNWNGSCADCHSTNLKKNYSRAEDSFQTTYSDINVSCEACHGPGSLHTQQPETFQLTLSNNLTANWLFPEGASIAQRVPALEEHGESQICARCHSRRSQLTDEHNPGDPLLDAFRPSLLDNEIYHPDGQIQEEVYVYGSFVQSKMYAAGVTCSDCHDPHTADLHFEGDALCAQCHLASTYANQSHNHHEVQNEQVTCANCHMPAQTYMTVDPRRDHSFRVPRPDLSIELGSPNACNNCHSQETPQWAVNHITEWFPQGRLETPHYGQAINAGRTWSAERTSLLLSLVNDSSLPSIVRATGIRLLANQLDDLSVNTIEHLLQLDEPLIQLEGLAALHSIDIERRINLSQRFLTAPLRALRIEAAKLLLPARSELSNRRQADLDRALSEHWDSLNFNSERGEGLLSLGNAFIQMGDLAEAESTMRTAIDREPYLTAAYVNLADIYRQTGREMEAEVLLRSAIENNPQNPTGYFALGLSLVRSGQLREAVITLGDAATLAPNEPYYQYVAGIALNSNGEREAGLTTLHEVHNQFPGHRDTLFALATIYRDEENWDTAELYTRRLLSISPSDGPAQALLKEIEGIAIR